jgi:hypothetical protein
VHFWFSPKLDGITTSFACKNSELYIEFLDFANKTARSPNKGPNSRMGARDARQKCPSNGPLQNNNALIERASRNSAALNHAHRGNTDHIAMGCL